MCRQILIDQSDVDDPYAVSPPHQAGEQTTQRGGENLRAIETHANQEQGGDAMTTRRLRHNYKALDAIAEEFRHDFSAHQE
jgi:hypothetical protein